MMRTMTSSLSSNSVAVQYSYSVTGVDSTAKDNFRYIKDNYATKSELPTYIAGTGIDITNDEISVDNTVVAMKSDIPADELPSITSGDAGKVLAVNSGETGVEWINAGGSSGSDNLILIKTTDIPVNIAESGMTDIQKEVFNALLGLYNNPDKIVYLNIGGSGIAQFVGTNTSYRKVYFQKIASGNNDSVNLQNGNR